MNGTGIIIHTNLGRSPLSEEAISAMNEVARGYSTLEYDVEKGRRGSRHNLVKDLLIAITGAEDALVTNNNASALLLSLSAFSKRKEVIVSRGQLVEIGGSFRIPDVCKVSGAKMVEVGTTNRTRLSDYQKTISPKTGALLRVHPSNFRVIGFTEEVKLEELVELGLEHNLPIIDDLGSGALTDIADYSSLPSEPLVQKSVSAGMSVVTFSGDKLLGGPQAGIAVGKKEYINKMRKHPLMRAVRPDKLTFAALEVTLKQYLVTKGMDEKLPIWKMMSISNHELENFGETVIKNISSVIQKKDLRVAIKESEAHTGGGSMPEEVLPSRALVIEGKGRSLNRLQKKLRLGKPSVIGYLKDDGFWLDLRTLVIESLDEICSTLNNTLEDIK